MVKCPSYFRSLRNGFQNSPEERYTIYCANIRLFSFRGEFKSSRRANKQTHPNKTTRTTGGNIPLQKRFPDTQQLNLTCSMLLQAFLASFEAQDSPHEREQTAESWKNMFICEEKEKVRAASKAWG